MDAEQLLKTALEGLEDLESSVEEPQVVEVLANMAAAAGKHAAAEEQNLSRFIGIPFKYGGPSLNIDLHLSHKMKYI